MFVIQDWTDPRGIVDFKIFVFSVINSFLKTSFITLILQPDSVLEFQDLTWNYLANNLLPGFGFLCFLSLIIS